jgi:hypothetical protein
MLAGPQGMKVASWRSRMRRSDLCTCKYRMLVTGVLNQASSYQSNTHVGGIGFAHDDVENRDVAAVLAWAG